MVVCQAALFIPDTDDIMCNYLFPMTTSLHIINQYYGCGTTKLHVHVHVYTCTTCPENNHALNVQMYTVYTSIYMKVHVYSTPEKEKGKKEKGKGEKKCTYMYMYTRDRKNISKAEQQTRGKKH